MSSSELHKPRMVKIRFPLPQNDPSGGEAEWMWAEATENSGYTVKNVPTFLFGISFGDTVRTKILDGCLEFESILARGGHSTYRIYSKVDQDDDNLKTLLNRLTSLHCEFERATHKVVGVDVLPEANIHAVYETLQGAEDAGFIEFEEGHCGHTVKTEE